MAEYKGIQGYSVQTLSSDPPAGSGSEGQLWYNTTSNVWKICLGGAGTWASGGALNEARQKLGGAGSQTSALCLGGFNGPPSAPVYVTANVETYNGTSWTETAELLQYGQGRIGVGIVSTAAMCVGGNTYPQDAITNSETYNGTSWTEGNNLVSGRWLGAGMGITTAAITAGGATGAGPEYGSVTVCETYDGTSWSETNNLNTARYYLGGAGTSSDAIVFAGNAEPGPGHSAAAETWNGTSWTVTNNLNAARYGGAATWMGTSDSALYFGGFDIPESKTDSVELWNGTSWTEVNDLSTPTVYMGGAGTASAGLSFGGQGPPGPTMVTTTEEWTNPVFSIETVTVS